MIDFSHQPLFLAPLAGLSDKPFRQIVKELGCDVTISEMLSANALIYESEKTLKMAQRSESESPYIVQIEGANDEIIRRAVEVLNSLEYIDGIDLNCGCPVPKVIKQGAGSALLKEPKLLCKLVEIIKKTSNKKYTSVKLRLGFSEKNLPNFARDIQNAGADFLCIHARTRAGGFSATPDYELLGEIKSRLSIPLIANGGISEDNFAQILTKTHANGLMIGTGAIGKPWIFSLIKSGKGVSNDERKNIVLKHFRLMLEHYGNHGVSLFRKHLHEYSKGIIGSSEFRREINEIKEPEIISRKINEFF